MAKALILATLAACTQLANGLYFYLDVKTPRCFTENLDAHMLWSVQAWMPDLAEINDYREAEGLKELKVKVEITELETEEVVVTDSYESEGNIAFTASQNGGVYRVCFSRTETTVRTIQPCFCVFLFFIFVVVGAARGSREKSGANTDDCEY